MEKTTTTRCDRCQEDIIDERDTYFTGFDVLCHTCMIDLAMAAWKAEKQAKRDAAKS